MRQTFTKLNVEGFFQPLLELLWALMDHIWAPCWAQGRQNTRQDESKVDSRQCLGIHMANETDSEAALGAKSELPPAQFLTFWQCRFGATK